MNAAPSLRGSGRTTKQIKEAPQRAYFIVGTDSAVSYVKHIAYANNREDLRFQSVRSFFDGQRHRGVLRSQVVVDHDVLESLPAPEYHRVVSILAHMHD